MKSSGIALVMITMMFGSISYAEPFPDLFQLSDYPYAHVIMDGSADPYSHPTPTSILSGISSGPIDDTIWALTFFDETYAHGSPPSSSPFPIPEPETAILLGTGIFIIRHLSRNAPDRENLSDHGPTLRNDKFVSSLQSL
jgi:hypothetical protein